MSENTKIQWTDSTVNPTMGCDGCEHWDPKKGITTCYAGVLHERHSKTNVGYAGDFRIVETTPGRMEAAAKLRPLTGETRLTAPWRDGLPRLTFVSDMSDALSKAISFDYLLGELIYWVMSPQGQRHEWQWLTKRPKRMAEFSQWLEAKGIKWPANLWAGTSLTDVKSLHRIKPLTEVGNEKTIHFLSVEPQYGEISLKNHLDEIEWVIQGGASGHGAKPFDEDWVRVIRDECRDTDTAYFLKQMGENPTRGGISYKLDDEHGSEWTEWAEEFRVRQFPTLTSEH